MRRDDRYERRFTEGRAAHMNKGVVVLDIPESCLKCPLRCANDECILQDEDTNFNADSFDDLRSSCPIKPMPEKKDICGKYDSHSKEMPSMKIGWNKCIDEILGEVN